MHSTLEQQYHLADLLQQNKAMQSLYLAELNAELEKLSAEQRIKWAQEHLPGQQVVSSSFGIQAAVMLSLVTKQQPEVPVILTDTGYLFPETYQFIDTLTEQLSLNIKTYRSELSPAWQEARFGQLWLQGVEGIKKYNQLNKVEPMRRALKELDASVWFSGLRREQSESRSNLPVLSVQNGVFKFLPIVDWSEEQVADYLEQNNLPYHPLKESGYTSLGDHHTTRKQEEGMNQEETRFFGLKRECGLHEDDDLQQDGLGI